MNIRDWFSLLLTGRITSQGTLKSLLQHHSSKASVLPHSAFFIAQHSHSYMTTGKTIALTRWTFLGKVMSLLCIWPRLGFPHNQYWIMFWRWQASRPSWGLHPHCQGPLPHRGPQGSAQAPHYRGAEQSLKETTALRVYQKWIFSQPTAGTQPPVDCSKAQAQAESPLLLRIWSRHSTKQQPLSLGPGGGRP